MGSEFKLTTENLRANRREAFLLPVLFPLPCSSFTRVRTRRLPLPVSGPGPRALPVLPFPRSRSRPGPSSLGGPETEMECMWWRPVKSVRHARLTTVKLPHLERDLERVLERASFVFFSDSKISSSTVSCPSSSSMSWTTDTTFIHSWLNGSQLRHLNIHSREVNTYISLFVHYSTWVERDNV